MMSPIFRLIRHLSVRTGLLERTLFSVYPYAHEPCHLEYLLGTLRTIRNVPGTCLEVGCAFGATTALLKRQLTYLGDDRRYVAIDTFAGFTDRDVAHEVAVRGKDIAPYGCFRDNDRAWVRRSLDLSGATDVELIQADCVHFDYVGIGPIAFCLIDVDLYLPVSSALSSIYPLMMPGGVIVVDDCAPGTSWDGALQAYTEFVEAHGLPHDVHCDKLGVIACTSSA